MMACTAHTPGMSRAVHGVGSMPSLGAGSGMDTRTAYSYGLGAAKKADADTDFANCIPGFPAEEVHLTGDPGEAMREP
jgi:hypothetical protein